MILRLEANEVDCECFTKIDSQFKDIKGDNAGHIYSVIAKNGDVIMTANIPYGILSMKEGYFLIAESFDPLDEKNLAKYADQNCGNGD